jgi:hypothetical protein
VAPGNLNQDPIRSKSREHIYTVLTDGYGRMTSFQRRLDASERWMVASFVKALQLSRSFRVRDLEADDRRNLP